MCRARGTVGAKISSYAANSPRSSAANAAAAAGAIAANTPSSASEWPLASPRISSG